MRSEMESLAIAESSGPLNYRKAASKTLAQQY